MVVLTRKSTPAFMLALARTISSVERARPVSSGRSTTILQELASQVEIVLLDAETALSPRDREAVLSKLHVLEKMVDDAT